MLNVVCRHEGIGVVSNVGSCVKDVVVGDTVGITWIRDSCQQCGNCRSGRENICETGYQGTYLGKSAGSFGRDPHNEHGGCFSSVMRIQSRFAVKIPSDISPELACPLLCGGGTVFEAIVNYVTPGVKVAVSSIGGLGTAAIKLAKMYGAHVTAFSRTASKEAGALKAGANTFAACLGDKAKITKFAASFDLIIDTCPANSPIDILLGMLKINGTYVRVGIPPANDNTFSTDFIPLIFTQKKITGSIVTGTKRMQELMNIASELPRDGDEWKTEIIPFEKVNEVIGKLYRGENVSTWRYILKW